MAFKKSLSHNIIYCSECHGLVNEEDTICMHCNKSFIKTADSIKLDKYQNNDLLIYSNSGLILIYDESHPPTELIKSLNGLAKLGTTWDPDLLNKHKSEHLFYIDTLEEYGDTMAIPILLTFNKSDHENKLRHYKKSIKKYLLNLSSSTLIIGKFDNVLPGDLFPPLFKKFLPISSGYYSINVFELEMEEECEHILSKQEIYWFKLSNFLSNIGCGFTGLSAISLLLLNMLILDDLVIIILLNFILWIIILFVKEIPSIKNIKKKISDYKSSIQNLPNYILEFNRADNIDDLITGGIRICEEFE